MITTRTSDELFSRINIDDFRRPRTFKITGFYWFLRSLAAAHTPRMNCDEMAGDSKTDSLRTGTAIGFHASREH